jgi:RimJ/RimL family protein N-acetyltransferase
VGGRVFNHEEVWARVCRYVGHWTLYGYGYWAVREKETGAFVGEVGFGFFRRQLDPPLEPRPVGAPEAGWALARKQQNKGYGREAVGAALAWADTRFSQVPANARSIALANTLGFAELARTQYHGEDTVVFSRAKPA